MRKMHELKCIKMNHMQHTACVQCNDTISLNEKQKLISCS